MLKKPDPAMRLVPLSSSHLENRARSLHGEPDGGTQRREYFVRRTAIGMGFSFQTEWINAQGAEGKRSVWARSKTQGMASY